LSSINRKPHCLKREKTLAIPRQMIFFDVETKPEILDNGSIKQRFKLGWACYYQRAYNRNLEKHEWYYFEDVELFWQFVDRHTEPKRKIWLLARNLVFDFTVLQGWRHLRHAGYKLKFFHNSGSTSIISVHKKGSSIVFLDIMNWFVESLAETGNRIGIPKLKIDFETCDDSYLKTYGKRDVEIEVENFKRFIRFLDGNSISRLCYTRGSTAMAAYLFGHYRKKIWIHNNEQAIGLERDSYRGGRVECFSLGEFNDGNYYIVDVNSLYPFVMRNNPYPVKYRKIMSGNTIISLHKILESQAVIAQVLIETDDPVYAVRRKRTIFPVGRFWVTLTTPELKYALDHDHILRVGQTVVYDQANIFKSYVDKFYGLREEFRTAGIAEYEEICKKMLNSLYGKFGQKAEVWTKIGDCPGEPDRVEICFVSGKSGVRQIRYLLGEIFELTGYEECFNSFPAIASEVSAYGRMYLWSLMKQAGDGNYLYCDTDSLIINEVGLCNLQSRIEPGVLGGLKIEETTNNVNIKGLKDYTTQRKNVIKGIRKNAVEIRPGVYEQDQWSSFKGLLRSADSDVYTIRKVKKILCREYTKGRVMVSGLIVPFVLAEPVELPRLLC